MRLDRWGILLTSLLVMGCSRAIPKPGDAQMLTQTHRVIGENYFSTKTVALNVQNATESMSSYQNDIVKLYFLLPQRYAMYRKADITSLVSTGTYQYTLNFYHVNEGELNLEGKNGLMIHLLFNNTLSGTFYAKANVVSKPGYLSGRFTVLP